MTIALGLLIGILAGVSSGFFGIGGGIIIVPACIYMFAMNQKQAQGTSLIALLLPTGALAFYNYWKSGRMDNQSITIGFAIAVGLFVGGFFGSKIALGLDETVLRRCFAGFLVLVALQLVFKK
jgi:uncharacterized membrane protein YfcA